MAHATAKVVVIGGSYVDLAIRCDEIPSLGETVVGSELSYTIKGPGPNQAAQAALCGCQVHLISKIGSDPFAQMLRNNLANFNVNTDFVFIAEARNTGVIVTMVNAEGENASRAASGANSALIPEDIDTAENIIAKADVCLIHGRLPRDTIIRALRTAEVAGTKVILDPAKPIGYVEDSAHLPQDFFSASVLIPDMEKAAEITNGSPYNVRQAKLIGSELVARGAKQVIIKMGSRGCMFVNRDRSEHVPAFEIDLVDHTCSGDAFGGALAAYFAVDDNITEAVKFASAAGALACTKFGSIESLPTKAEIIELLQKQT